MARSKSMCRRAAFGRHPGLRRRRKSTRDGLVRGPRIALWMPVGRLISVRFIVPWRINIQTSIKSSTSRLSAVVSGRRFRVRAMFHRPGIRLSAASDHPGSLRRRSSFLVRPISSSRFGAPISPWAATSFKPSTLPAIRYSIARRHRVISASHGLLRWGVHSTRRSLGRSIRAVSPLTGESSFHRDQLRRQMASRSWSLFGEPTSW